MSDDPRKRELVEKVGGLVRHRYGGDYAAAFDDFDGDRDGKMTRPELVELLAQAGVGNLVTRRAWAAAVLDALDVDADRGVSWFEFEQAVREG